MKTTEYLVWLAEQDNKGVSPDERAIVRGWDGKEIIRGVPDIKEVGRMMTISIAGQEFGTWPVGTDEECWLDSDGHLVYIYQEKLDQPGPPSMDLDDTSPSV